MVLKLKNRNENPRKKILIYGLDGTGKSTFAEKYCKENNLNPLVIDVDDTNFTNLPIMDLHFANDIQAYKNVKDTVKEIGKTSEYDTIILDGVTSLLEMLTSKSKGMAAYSDRSRRWNDILFELENTRKNLIFIGQIDMQMMFSEDYQPSKAVIKVNSLVNEKYYCYIDDKNNYLIDVKKFRTIEQIESEAFQQNKKEEPIEEPNKVFDTNENIFKSSPEEKAKSIIAELPRKTLGNAYDELHRLHRNGFITDGECPQVKEELERLIS